MVSNQLKKYNLWVACYFKVFMLGEGGIYSYIRYNSFSLSKVEAMNGEKHTVSYI